MLLVDSSEFPKQGHESVGVPRQYCGQLGKAKNCQSGVFVGYASDKGHRLLDARLYLPEMWFEEEFRERREKTGIPDDRLFRTKPAIAGDLIEKVADEGLFSARWIGCDATFGMDRAFLEGLPPDRWYFAAVRSNLHILTDSPQWAVPERTGARGKGPSKEKLTEAPRTVSEFVQTASFTPLVLKEVSRGPMGAFVHASRVFRAPATPEEPSRPEWLIVLKTPDGELHYALSNAPEDTSLDTFAQTLRWSLERCFEEAKSHLGMGHYEHRSYKGWHRHMLYVFLAHHFLQNIRGSLKKNSGLFRHGPEIHRLRHFLGAFHPGKGSRNSRVHPEKKRVRRKVPLETVPDPAQGSGTQHRLNDPILPALFPGILGNPFPYPECVIPGPLFPDNPFGPSCFSNF
jgi:SRSO17 transposase